MGGTYPAFLLQRFYKVHFTNRSCPKLLFAFCSLSSKPVLQASSLCSSKQTISNISNKSLFCIGHQDSREYSAVSRQPRASHACSAGTGFRTGLQVNYNRLKNSYIGVKYSSLLPAIYGIPVCRSFSSQVDGNASDELSTEAPTSLNTEGPSAEVTDIVHNAAKNATKSIENGIVYLETKIKATSEVVTPVVQQWFDSYPCLKDIIIPASWTVIASLLAWMVMPRMLRKLHHYTEETSLALYLGRKPNRQIVYERSFWGALEDPVRYLVTFLALSQLGLMIAPSTVSQYMPQIWRGAVIVSVLWFLQRWKRNIFSSLSAQQILDRERFMALDKISSVALFVLGGLAFAESSGIAVQSVLTVGGVGGIAAAIAARDLLGNTITGLSLQLSQPFTVGDTIKAGSVEGKVTEIGLTTTTLLNPEKFPVIIPNSFLASQIIVNKSRAPCHTLVSKVPLQIDDYDEIPKITMEIEDMLTINSKVVFEPERPQCAVSRVGPFWELTVTCNMKPMAKSDLSLTRQQLLLGCAKIIKKHGAKLSSIANQ
eukprot:TRINITY_DN17433_c0_g1_i1.p1 TRINITY_DN17433_c0_g1~~TRINITY_DN17433_c0_g1_i1.p1  ORF type:complete len:541 (+),score=86.40 TRINITY_DN17433_c0_g1_i1:258-1880(+)